MFKWIQVERHDGRRNGEPWCSTLEHAKPAKGIDRPWRLTVIRGWPAYSNRESLPRGEVNAKPAVFATFEDEATARAAYAAAVKNEKTK